MGYKANIVCFLVCLCLLEVSASLRRERNKKAYRVVCYLGSWANYRHGDGKFLMEDIDPFQCTHLIYGFAKLENNKITPFDPWLDLEDNWGLKGYKRFNNHRKTNPELTTLIAIGGWNEGSAKYSKMAASAATRKIFVQSVLEFLKKYDFDGLDFDWEYPGSREGSAPEDKENFLQVVKELRDAFERDGYLLTSAVSAGRETIDLAYAIPKITELMDFINIMAYDFHGSWETFTGHNAPLYARPDETEAQSHLNVDYGVNYWIKNGAAPKKLVLGMALYGRSFTLKNPSVNGFNAPTSGKGREGPFTREAGFLGFNEVCVMCKSQEWNRVVDKHHLAPYIYRGDQWCGYDDVESIAVKVDYLKQKGLSGGMVWSIETDDFKGLCYGKKYPLLRAINDRLNNVVVVPPKDSYCVYRPDKPHNNSTVTTTSSTLVTPSYQCVSEGSFANEHDCNSYYQCIHRPYGYEKIERRCPPGTAFHSELKTCMFPTDVPGCGRKIEKDSLSSTTTTTTTTAPPVKFVCSSEGLFPNPDNCKDFYKCGPGVLGLRAALFHCPMELYYNPMIKTCDYPEHVNCKDRS